ncbi:MAG: hypothetical protein QM765_39135 [Myxococcales bacterium]
MIVTHAHDDHIGCLPFLVEHGLLKAKWALVADPGLGWGRSAAGKRDDTAVDPRARRVLAALREDYSSDWAREIAADGESLETAYEDMLAALKSAGTKVVRYGRDAHAPLVKALNGKYKVGIEILGPRPADLLVCAHRLAGFRDQLIDALDQYFRADSEADVAGVVRQLRDATDAGRAGNLVNLQSIVTAFSYAGKKFLFTGDMQLAEPGIADGTIEEGIGQLLAAIAKAAPFDFVKLAHHGSSNGFDDSIHGQMGEPELLAICAGAGSTKHPSPSVLKLLQRHKNLRWARTDHNGLVSLFFDGAKVKIELGDGKLNDPEPNADRAIEVAPAEVPAAPTPAPEQAVQSRVEPPVVVRRPADTAPVELVARLPRNTRVRMQLTVDVLPLGEPSGLPEQDDKEVPPRGNGATLKIGGNRPLPRLLFATCPRRLAKNIGHPDADEILEAARSASALLELPDSPSAAMLAPAVWSEAERVGARGVVLLGGYDVVPSQRLDCLPKTVRKEVESEGIDDPDNFIIWSDDVYGDKDADGWPELPVARVPDAKSAAFMKQALSAQMPSGVSWGGVRNRFRPFADRVLQAVGSGALEESEPVSASRKPPRLAAEHLYLMLHGSDFDSSRFWGESAQHEMLEAVNTTTVPPRYEGVVFTGACWGALTVDAPASRFQGDRPLTSRSPETSMALCFLARGARAFVGCTGMHYSPTEDPFEYFGRPLHESFWNHLKKTGSPAEALLQAKNDYLAAMPHPNADDPGDLAIEHKILRQFTCLGLGW